MLKLNAALVGAKQRMRPARLTLALCVALTLSACSQSTDEMMASARDYLSKNDISAASIQLKNVLQQDGTIAEARFLLGSVYLAEGDVAGAVRELRRAQELGYPLVEVAPRLSRAMVLNGDYDRVVKEYAEVVVDDPAAQSQVLTSIGDAHIGRAEFAAAMVSFEGALSLQPEDVPARVGLARSLLFSGEVDRAMHEAERVVAADSGSADAHGVRAEVYRLRGQPDSVIEALGAALQANPRAINYHFALISVLVEQSRIDDAEARLADMQKVAADNPATLYVQAFLDFRKDRLEPARDAVEFLLRQAPNHHLGELLAGNIYLRLGDHLRARQHLERVLARQPGQVLARRALAASHLTTGNPLQAKETLQPLLDTGVEDPSAFTLAGQIFLALGDFDQASEYLGRASAINPDDFRVRTGLGLAQLGRGADQLGLAELEAVSALDDDGQADVVLILARLREGDLDKALLAHERLLSKRPDDPQTYNLLGAIMQARGDRHAARAAFQRALEVDPVFLSAAVNLARIDIAEGLAQDARERFTRIIEREPGRSETYLLMADLLRQTGSAPVEVRSILERGVQAVPGNSALRIALARQIAGMGDLRAALLIAQELNVSDPDDPAALGLLAQVQTQMGDRQQAVANLNRLVRLQPQSPEPLLMLAEVQRSNGDVNAAEQSLRRALVLKSDLVEAQQRLIALLAEQGKAEQAMRAVQAAKQQLPEAAAVYAWEGDLLASEGKWPEAALAYEQALRRDAGVDVVVKFHRALRQSDRHEDARALAQTWLEGSPNDVVMRVYLAEIAISAGNHADAEAFYRKVLPMQPDNPMILNNLAWVAGQLGRADALTLAQRAAEQAPLNAAVLDTLGAIQVREGLLDEGLANLEKAVELSPETPLLRLNLAKAYLEAGRKQDAYRELDRVIETTAADNPLAIEANSLRMQD